MQNSNQWNTGSLTFCVLAEILEYWTLLSKFKIMESQYQWNTGSFYPLCFSGDPTVLESFNQILNYAKFLEYWTLLSKF